MHLLQRASLLPPVGARRGAPGEAASGAGAMLLVVAGSSHNTFAGERRWLGLCCFFF